jgi:hypothetical protein
LLAALALSGGASCKSSNDCQSTRTFFEQQVWSAFMSTTCTKCHTPDGTAVADSNAKFVLQTSSYPGFIDANLANLTMVAAIQNNGTSELLLKPIGQLSHTGGTVIQPGGTEIKALTELVQRLSNGDSCTEGPNSTLQSVTLADGPTTLRRAAIDLAGRLPTAAEKASVTAGGDAALDAALDQLMTEDAFFNRVREIFNDQLLTDQYLNDSGSLINREDGSFYTNLQSYTDQMGANYMSPDKPMINYAMAREPLDLIAYVVKSGKPFTDVVAAPYAVVNPFLAKAYGLDKSISFKDSTNYNEFHEAQVTATLTTQNNNMTQTMPLPIPHAGVISTPAFLNRWPTTPTNRSRGRARRLFQFFLATDVLQIATRPVDATKVATLEDPTRNSTLCNVCHKVIDPVAGGFRGYKEDGDYQDLNPTDPWHDDMYAPGFGTSLMDSASYPKALQWLGPQIAQDPRFAISATHAVYQAMTGHAPLPYPADSSDPAFSTKLAAWESQDAFMRDTASAFSSNNFDLKVIFKQVIKSPYYRAVSAPADMDPNVLADVGTGRLLTPEMFNRKIKAILGYRWRQNYDMENPWERPHDWLLQDYMILYGGIDSESTITRLTKPNGIIGAVASRFANEMACAVTAFDFTKPKASRTLFNQVELAEVPESSGHTVDGSVTDIKATIQYLHEYLLDEKLDISDPEIERTYQLFLDTWHELSQAGNTGVPNDCQGQWDLATGKNLPMNQQITDDKNFTLRSWLAVMTYLLSDYKFLHE